MRPSAQVAPEALCVGNVLVGRLEHNRNMNPEIVGTSDTVDEETNTVENQDGSTRAGGRVAGRLGRLLFLAKATVEAVGPASAEQVGTHLHSCCWIYTHPKQKGG